MIFNKQKSEKENLVALLNEALDALSNEAKANAEDLENVTIENVAAIEGAAEDEGDDSITVNTTATVSYTPVNGSEAASTTFKWRRLNVNKVLEKAGLTASEDGSVHYDSYLALPTDNAKLEDKAHYVSLIKEKLELTGDNDTVITVNTVVADPEAGEVLVSGGPDASSLGLVGEFNHSVKIRGDDTGIYKLADDQLWHTYTLEESPTATGTFNKLILPKNATSIPDNAFANFTATPSQDFYLELPETITEIGSNAMPPNLKASSVDLTNIERLGANAFTAESEAVDFPVMLSEYEGTSLGTADKINFSQDVSINEILKAITKNIGNKDIENIDYVIVSNQNLLKTQSVDFLTPEFKVIRLGGNTQLLKGEDFDAFVAHLPESTKASVSSPIAVAEGSLKGVNLESFDIDAERDPVAENAFENITADVINITDLTKKPADSAFANATITTIKVPTTADIETVKAWACFADGHLSNTPEFVAVTPDPEVESDAVPEEVEASGYTYDGAPVNEDK